MTDLLTLAREVGFSQCAPVNMDALDPLEAVRDMCKADRCGRYGKSWSCPPACSTLEQARAQIKRYSQGILVQSTAQLEDEFDYTGMTSLLETHKKRFSTFARQARLLYPHCLPLTAAHARSAIPAPIRTVPVDIPSSGSLQWRPTDCSSVTSASAQTSPTTMVPAL